MRLEQLHKRLVCRVREILVAVLFSFERHKETMGKPIVQTFRAVVHTILKVGNLRNLGLQFAKCIDDLLNRFFGTGLFELKQNNVS